MSVLVGQDNSGQREEAEIPEVCPGASRQHGVVTEPEAVLGPLPLSRGRKLPQTPPTPSLRGTPLLRVLGSGRKQSARRVHRELDMTPRRPRSG